MSSNLRDFEQPALMLVDGFMNQIEAMRLELVPDEWRSEITKNSVIRKWRFFLTQDPYTRWGLLKPRGYPGDATLMDFAYGHKSIANQLGEPGSIARELYRHTFEAVQSISARSRVGQLTGLLEHLASTSTFSAASFASGHARELEGLSGAARGRLTHFFAVDTDLDSLAEARKSAGSLDFRAVNRNTVKDDLSEIGKVDLTYSLGLFDYLKGAHAVAVLTKMAAVTKANGLIVVANLAPEAANMGYCEAMMDWWMITRSERDMQELGDQLLHRGLSAEASVTRHGCFNYLYLQLKDV